MKESILQTEKYLRSFVPFITSNLLLSNTKWAIVGGFVRDAMISILSGKKVSSPDIDIVVVGSIPKIEINNEIIEIERNTFGGLKVETATFGSIDIWSLNDHIDYLSEDVSWNEYLKKIDFAINSIIFTYPDDKLYMHKEWLNSYKRREITTLYKFSPSPDLQVVRAVALALKLSLITGNCFKTSGSISHKLNNICYNKDSSYFKLIDYTTDKIIKNKWPDDVLIRLLDNIRIPESILREEEEILGI